MFDIQGLGHSEESLLKQRHKSLLLSLLALAPAALLSSCCDPATLLGAATAASGATLCSC